MLFLLKGLGRLKLLSLDLRFFKSFDLVSSLSVVAGVVLGAGYSVDSSVKFSGSVSSLASLTSVLSSVTGELFSPLVEKGLNLFLLNRPNREALDVAVDGDKDVDVEEDAVDPRVKGEIVVELKNLDIFLGLWLELRIWLKNG